MKQLNYEVLESTGYNGYILKNAPEKEAGCFSVPKVVEQEGKK